MAQITLSTSDSAKLEPKRKNRWIVSFDAIPGAAGVAGASEALAFCAHTGTRPEVTFDATEVNRLNEKWNFANRVAWNSLSFNFYDFIAATVDRSPFQLLTNWWRKIYEPLTGQMGYAIEYKTNATIALLDPKGVVVNTWHVFYMFPTKVGSTELDYSGDDIIDITAEFKYDYAVPGTERSVAAALTSAAGENYPSSTP